MAFSSNYHTIPGVAASSSLASYQYYVVKASSTAGQIKVGSASTDSLLGVLQNDPASGAAAEVAFLGICKAAAEASVTYGSRLTCSTTGRVKATTTDKDCLVGIALEASSSAGDIISIIAAPAYMTHS